MERTDETLTTRDLASSGRDEETTDERTSETRDEGAHPAAAAELDDAAAPTATATAAEPEAPRDDDAGSLFPEREEADFQRRWESIQTGFVDDPRATVKEADALVASVMQQLADGFAQERERLEGQWARGEDVSTEDLRVALQRYRSFFRRLLSA